MGATAQEIPRWQRIDVVWRRRLYFVISLVAIGLTRARDRSSRASTSASTSRGGVQITFTTPHPTSLHARAQADGCGRRGRRGRPGPRHPDRLGLLHELPDPAQEARPGKQDDLDADLTNDRPRPEARRQERLGELLGQILDGAILAICVSFVLIALYVTFRYRWRFAVPILRTLSTTSRS